MAQWYTHTYHTQNYVHIPIKVKSSMVLEANAKMKLVPDPFRSQNTSVINKSVLIPDNYFC